MARTIDYTKILQDNASFQLVRTNPKLTGNIKFTIDGNDKMWLNSINVNKELSKSLYKRVPIDPTMSLPANVYRFFNDGSTPNEVVFDLKESFDLTKTSSDFKDQYDFSKYFSGIRYLASRQYDERFSYFAPLFLKKDIPDFFVVFKINDPINYPIDKLTESYPYDREEYIKDLFKKSTIIKTFDLRETTKVGQYIRDYVNDINFPKNPLEVSYEKKDFTNFNGILYDSGVFGSRGELLSDFYQESNPLKFFEEFITLGFERNGVIFPNILNLEFIFNDETSEMYDFNRYIGFYINTIELSKLDVDLDRIYSTRRNWENTPAFRKEYYEWEDIRLDQTNLNGVIVPVKNSEVYFSDFEDIFTDKDSMFFNYLNDRFGGIHMLKLTDTFDIDYDESTELKSGILRTSDTYLDLGGFFGPKNLLIQDHGSKTNKRGFSYAYIKIEDTLKHLDSIKFYHPNGTRYDSFGKYELIESVIDYSELPDPGDFYAYNDIDNVTGHDVFYFNGEGFKKEIAKAIAGCINNIRNISVKAFAVNEYVFIKSNIAAECYSSYHLKFYSNDSYDTVTINDITGLDLDGNIIQFEGGSSQVGNRLIIDSNHRDKIVNRLDDILVKTVKGWSKIKGLSKYIDAIDEKKLKTQSDKDKAITDFFNNLVITLDLDIEPKLEAGEFTIRLKHRPSFGLLSFFPIKDFDFDFYSSEYINFPVLDLYKHYFIPPDVELMKPYEEYQVYGTGSIDTYDGAKSVGDVFDGDPSGNNLSYSVISGNPVVGPARLNYTTFQNLTNEVWDENEEFSSFTGFFLLKDPDKVIEEREDDAYNLRDRYINGIAETEYDYYKENFSKDFALKSKIIPYITKWVIPDGLDTRSNPYRLNTELSFGFNNFTPDHEDTSQNPANFTHEWFYIESNFNFTQDPKTIKLNNSYFDTPFNLDRALTEEGYFIDYFTYTPSFNGKEIGKTQSRYSPILKNSLGVYETFFKGFKIQFKDYIDSNNLNEAGKPEFNPNSTRFEDYKFTCLLKTTREDINDDETPPIRYRFIEHKDFKFIILLIELNIGSIDEISFMWKFYTGSLFPYASITNEPNQVGTVGENFRDGKRNFLENDPVAEIDKTFDGINGDYRIHFSPILGGDEISDITYAGLYSLKHKKFNMYDGNYSNIKLTKKALFNVYVNDIIDVTDFNTNFPQYPSDLIQEVHELDQTTFVLINDFVNGINYIVDESDGLSALNINPLTSVKRDGLVFSTDPSNTLVWTYDTGGIYQTVPMLTLPAQYFKDTFTFKIMKGGRLYFESLFEKLSFAKFKKFSNELDPFIEYHSYSYNSSLSTETANWYIEIPNRNIVTKKDAILVQVDSDKPANLAFNNVIGFNYERAELDNSYELNRYDGGFSPLFKDLFIFNSKFNFSKNDITALDLSNTLFNIDIPEFLKLQNFNHIKISKTKILNLESDEEYEPLYEIPGEIAIGKNEYSLLLSNWDYGFHWLYSDKTANAPSPGTLRIKEDDCFLSKIINLRTDIELEQIDVFKTSNLSTIDINEYEMVYEEKDTKIVGQINIKNIIRSYLIADGISSKFNEFLVNSTEFIGNYESIDDYIKVYIDTNITKLYELLSVEFYSKLDKTKTEDSDNSNLNSIEFKMLDDAGRFEQGFDLNRNLKINKIDRFILNFEFAKNISSGIIISPKIKIKFI